MSDDDPNKQQLREWISRELRGVLQLDSAEDLSRYIISMQSENDVEEYCHSLLDFKDPDQFRFYQELLQKWNGDWSGDLKYDSATGLAASSHQSPLPSVKKDECSLGASGSLEFHGHKKKTKYVNLYSQEGQNKDVILLRGRHRCDCQASKHTLVNNCLKCGRIVCQQEGAGPCFFCGSLVCTPEEMKAISRNTKQSESLKKKLMSQPKQDGLMKAEAQRNRLLEYDRTSERRTRVIDDDSDYYSIHSVWLSPKERETLKNKLEAEQARKHASRREARFTLDFAGRQVFEDTLNLEAAVYQDEEETLREVQAKCKDVNVDPSVNFKGLAFEESFMSKKLRSRNTDCSSLQKSRVQDQEFLKMADMGKCLSMHQPWASYLISGIKLHEGRNWYTSHRGRLWIASAAKQPDPKMVAELENTYRIFRNDENLRFPQHLPTSCLLGCVTLVDCLSQEEYRKVYPEGESDSPFVFICEDPLELPVRFPMQGHHKIYQLDGKIHSAALKSLQRIAQIKSDSAAKE